MFVDGLYAIGDNISKISTNRMIKLYVATFIYVIMLWFIIYVIINVCMFMGISLYMLHICVYCYFSTKSFITECNCLFMFKCKSSARVFHVYVIIACSLKRKFMWHRLVEYCVCYSMFRNERTKVFPHVAWPDHGWPGTLQYGIRASVPTLSLDWLERFS